MFVFNSSDINGAWPGHGMSTFSFIEERSSATFTKSPVTGMEPAETFARSGNINMNNIKFILVQIFSYFKIKMEYPKKSFPNDFKLEYIFII